MLGLRKFLNSRRPLSTRGFTSKMVVRQGVVAYPPQFSGAIMNIHVSIETLEGLSTVTAMFDPTTSSNHPVASDRVFLRKLRDEWHVIAISKKTTDGKSSIEKLECIHPERVSLDKLCENCPRRSSN